MPPPGYPLWASIWMKTEFLSLFTLPLETARSMVLSGEITDGKTVAAVLKVCALREAGKL